MSMTPLSRECRSHRAGKSWRRFVGGILLIVGAVIIFWRQDQQQHLAQLKRESARLTEQYTDLLHHKNQRQKAFSQSANKGRAASRKSAYWGERLNALFQQIPEGCWLQTVSAQASSLQLKGGALQDLDFKHLMSQLARLSCIERIDITEMRDQGPDGIFFAVKLHYAGVFNAAK